MNFLRITRKLSSSHFYRIINWKRMKNFLLLSTAKSTYLTDKQSHIIVCPLIWLMIFPLEYTVKRTVIHNIQANRTEHSSCSFFLFVRSHAAFLTDRSSQTNEEKSIITIASNQTWIVIWLIYLWKYYSRSSTNWTIWMFYTHL